MIEKIAQITHLKLSSSDNLFESMQSMADAVGFSASMRTAALTLLRITNDLRLLASGPATGLDEIQLPALQPGSSIMPGKVNPVMAEMVGMTMMHIVGADSVVAIAAQAGQLELNVMMPVIAFELFEMMHLLISSIQTFSSKAVHGIRANREKAARWLERNAIIVTALNPLIGYEQGAALVKEAVAKNLSIINLAVEKATRGEIFHRDKNTQVKPEEILAALGNLRKMTEPG
jgi:fumarate hydratase class II